MDVHETKGMTLIVKTVTKITLGFILLYGVYITLNGHTAPGGGFAGGVIVALSLVHIMLAFGKEVALKRLHSYILRCVIGLVALCFLYIVMVGITGGCLPLNIALAPGLSCRIFNNQLVMPICEMVMVSGGVFAIFIALVLLSKTDKDSE